MTEMPQLRRIAAFADTPRGGNPAGVWVGDTLPGEDEMLAIAAEVGFSETAFVAPSSGQRRRVRYFSPEAEVPFCGHATIAAGFALSSGARGETFTLETQAGDVPVQVERAGGQVLVSLTSVATRHKDVEQDQLGEYLRALGWDESELDKSIPPVIAFAGAWHLVLAAGSGSRLADLDYDFDGLRALMLRDELTTVQLVFRESAGVFQVRNPFPVGGVVEDPATGAAAAALGGYLRDALLISAPATLHLKQGDAIGRPSRLTVTVPRTGGVTVSGTAVDM